MADNGSSNNLDFTFFKYLLQFYKRNQKKIKGHYQLITNKFLDFNEDGFLRTPQFEALEIYIFLKEFMNNAPVHKIFEQWYYDEGKFVNFDTAQTNLFSQFDDDNTRIIGHGEEHLLQILNIFVFEILPGDPA